MGNVQHVINTGNINIKNNNNRIEVITVLLCALIPLIVVSFFSLIAKVPFGDVCIPNSNWNDELMYFKQVEGIVENGEIGGAFGYNESVARYGNFAVWSPVLLVMWMLFGKVIGWNFISPLIINLLLLSLGYCVFAILCKPNIKQIVSLAVLSLFYIPLSRFTLSCLPEATCYSLAMIFVSLCIYFKNKDVYTIGGLVVLSMILELLILMRPFYLVFVVPVFVQCSRVFSKRKSIIVSVLILGAAISSYYVLINSFTATYFIPVINFSWLKLLLTSPVVGIKSVINEFIDAGSFCARECISIGQFNFSIQGAWSLTFLFIICIELISLIRNRKKEKLLSLYRVCALLCIFAAAVLFFNLSDGSKHFSEFIFIGIILLSYEGNYKKITAVVAVVVVLFLMPCMLKKDGFYSLPSKNDTIENEVNNIGKSFDQDFETWDKTVIWVFSDENKEETKWNYLYGIPDGYGINLCLHDYVCENIDNLKSKYIYCAKGDSICELLCQESELIYSNSEICLWKTR